MDNINRLQQLLLREQGLSKCINYDFALGRLCVAKEDSWRGIAASNLSVDYNPEPPIFSAKFANFDGYRHILAIANEDGKIALQDTTKRNKEMDERPLVAPQCHFNAVFDLEWVPNKMCFLSASGDHTARLWKVTNSDIRSVTVFVGHSRSVKTVACRRDHDEVFASGARDGAIIIWDMRTPMKQTSVNDNCIQSGHGTSSIASLSSYKRRARNTKPFINAPTSTVTGLIFQDANTLISCGASDGIIKVWDLRRNYTIHKKDPQPKYSIPYAGISTLKGYTNLIADQSGVRLYASCMDNTIYAFNISSYDVRPLARYRGANIGTFYIKSCLSPDNKYLASGSSDDKAYIWNLEYPDQPLVSLNGHNVEVTCVAWGTSHDQPLVTCSDDARHKIWRMASGSLTDLTEQYCGHAEYIRRFTIKPKNRNDLKYWQNDLRESETLVTVGKRNLTEHLSNLGNDEENSYDSLNDCLQVRKKARPLEKTIPELFTNVNRNESNDELPCSSNIVCNTTGHFSVIPEEIDHEKEKSSPAPSQLSLPSNLLDSPTSNLPNFVLNGEAPHLTVMSPKRQHEHQQVKVDWLTKIRKQKLMMTHRANLNDKIKTLNLQYNQEINMEVNDVTVTTDITNNNNSNPIINSNNTNPTTNININGNSNTTNIPTVQSELYSPCLDDIQLQSSVVMIPIMRANSLTPKRQRRSSHCSITGSGGGRGHNRAMSPSNNPHHHILHRHTARTPTSSRRNSETTLLRFFTRQRSTTSPIKGQSQENQENFPGNDQRTAIMQFKDTNEHQQQQQQHQQQQQQPQGQQHDNNNNNKNNTITCSPHA